MRDLLNRFLRKPASEPQQPSTLPSSSPTSATTAVLESPPSTRPARGDAPANSDAGDTDHAPPRRRRSRSRKRGGAAGTETSPSSTDNAPRKASFDGPLPEAFAALGIEETALRAIAALGFDIPTPIQEQTIPLLQRGDDVVGLAQTGTGKTLAFGIPLARSIDPQERQVQGLVLVPTRELANQVMETIDQLGSFYGFDTVCLVGGRKLTTDFRNLDDRPNVVVGTPGRVIDHIKRGTLDVTTVRFLVLDEADQMFDIGFARDIDYIIRRIPRERQSALFSATMPPDIKALVRRYMNEAVEISVSANQTPAEGVQQFYCEVAEREKFFALRHLYEELELGRSLIFRRTRAGVDRLASQLQQAGVSARPIHGDLSQGERDHVMKDFRGGKLEFLVATNVAARGLDIPDIQHVINYDVPQNAEEYIHRVGRTARAGKSGKSVTFVSEWELEEWDRIVRSIKGARPEYLEMPTRWD